MVLDRVEAGDFACGEIDVPDRAVDQRGVEAALQEACSVMRVSVMLSAAWTAPGAIRVKAKAMAAMCLIFGRCSFAREKFHDASD
jgi:hypothetical protein